MRYVDHVEKNDRTLGGAYIPHDVFYIAPFPAQPDGILYQMNRAGIVCCTPPDFQIGRHDAYAYHLIHCVISGRGTVTLGDQTYRLQRGQIFLLPAYEAHNYCSDPKDPMGLVWIEFCGGDSNRLVKASMDRSTPVFEGPVFQTVVELCTSLLYQPSLPAPEVVSRTIYEMLLALYAHARRHNSKQEALTQKFVTYMDDHLHEPLHLADVAQAFGYHPAYFSNLFLKNTGVSFSKYLLHRRISRACYLLVTTDLPLERIAHDLGFCDASHFAHRFRQVEGVSPSLYRRENHGFATQDPQATSFGPTPPAPVVV